MAKKEEIIEVTNESEIKVTSVTVSSLIHIIRGKQVILDSDLAMLYQVETGAMPAMFRNGIYQSCSTVIRRKAFMTY